jgi:tRNA-dihydrouridine synthase B
MSGTADNSGSVPGGQPPLTEPFEIGGVRIANRVLLAPLAGIGNWFVRLQARRHGAGLAVSEMVSSFGLHYRNERTLRELLRIHPDEHPVAVQLFGHDPEVMRSGAAIAAEAGADLIDINMGCPVRKVQKTGAGAALLAEHDLALALLRGAREGGGVPVTVKLRSGLEAGDRSGFELALRLAEEGGAAAIAFHPRSAAAQHRGEPDYALARELVERIDVPVVISGGLRTAKAARRAYELSGSAAVMIARGALGYPWVFEELTGRRANPPSNAEIVAEALWVIDRAEDHFGGERAARYLRKFYAWYLERLPAPTPLAEELQQSAGVGRARELLAQLAEPPGAAPDRLAADLPSALSARIGPSL